MANSKDGDILKLAADIFNEKREIAQECRDLQNRLKGLDNRFDKMQKFILENVGFYYCESCETWFKKEEMRRIDDNQPLCGGNICAACSDERYFRQLAKSSINQLGISLYNVPEELIAEKEYQRAIIKTFAYRKEPTNIYTANIMRPIPMI